MRALALAVLAATPFACGDGSDRADGEGDRRALQTLPYASWNPREGGAAGGVTHHDPERASRGVNLYSSLPRTEAVLMDMDGAVLHRWSRDTGKEWEHVELLANGDLLVLNEEPRKLIRLTWDSAVVWESELWAHHDVDVTDDGAIFVLTAENKMLEIGGREIPVRDHAIAVLSDDGNLLKSVPFSRLLRDVIDVEELARFVDSGMKEDRGFRLMGDYVDLFHTNTLAVIRESVDDVFQRGSVLFAARNLNLIGVVDVDREELVWSWGPGELDWPHQPTLLDGGTVLVFDNGTHRGFSRIVELEPASGAIRWEYRAEPPETFHSRTMGGVQGLPNGNVLVTESLKGHAFEITRDAEVVWEFWNPDVDEAKAKRATIYRMTRIPLDFVKR